MVVASPIATNMILLFLTLIFADPVQPIPRPTHISGPEDVFVFKNEAVNLTCNVGVTPGFAVVWQAVAGDGTGTIVGKCFNCPLRQACSVGTGMESEYSVMELNNTYTLTILRPQVPQTNTFGHFQCGYQEIKTCDVSPPLSPLSTQGRYNLFRSAIVYVYDFPTCTSALTPLQGNFLHDLTCTWTPRFYETSENKVRVELKINEIRVQPELQLHLPHGIVQRYQFESSQELENVIGNASCTVVLSGKVARSCIFPLPKEQVASVVIKPLRANIRAGQSLNFSCDVQHDSPEQPLRSWEIFEGQEPSEKILTSTRSKAGDVTFASTTKQSLELRPRTGGTHYFLECSVETVDGRNVSAFAYVGEMPVEDFTTGIPPTAPADTLQNATAKAEEKPPVKDEKNNMTGILIFIIVPIVLIVVFFVVGFVIVRKRTLSRTFKQPPRKMEANYSNMGSNDNMISVGNDGDGYQEQIVDAHME